MNRYKFNLSHLDTCTPDYFLGCNMAYAQIPVYKGMKLTDIKSAIREELRFGDIQGNNDDAFLLSADYVGEDRATDAAKCFKAAIAAVNRMKPTKKGQRTFFNDLEEDSEDNDCTVYAYFAFVPVE